MTTATVLAESPDYCLPILASHLKTGELAMVVGAGISQGLGLPDWKELVSRCAVSASVPFGAEDFGDFDKVRRLTERIEVKAGSTFREIVRGALYSTYRSDDIFTHRLLIAIGAICMGSTRGSTSEVLSFNFDDVLERYLHLYGYTWQTITKLPVLRKRVDVTIAHPHGYLPSPDSRLGTDSDELIFSQQSFDERLGQRLNAWTDLLRDLLLRKVVLFLGVSANSPTLTAVAAAVGRDLETHRITGYWFLGPNDPVDDNGLLLRRNIVPMRFADYADYATFLMNICRSAAHP